MKPSRLLCLAAFALCAGCTSLDNPLSGFRILQTGRDARTFNMQTGEYEWPKEAAPRPRPQAPLSAPATPPPKADR